jgi:hypothetical protein
LAKGDDVFDAAGLAAEGFQGLFDGEAMRDEPTYRGRPSLQECAQIRDGVGEALDAGVHGAEHDLILQHVIAHKRIRVEGHRPLAARDSGEDEDAIGPQVRHHLKRQLRGADCLIHHVDVADGLGQVFQRGGFRMYELGAEAGD